MKRKSIICLVALILANFTVKAQTIWGGAKMTFTKAASADFTLEANQDRLTSNVWITRGNSKGIFNIATESSYSDSVSPQNTEWAYGTTADIGSLTFTTWRIWVGGNPPGTVGKNAVLHIISEDIYIDIKFLSWGSAGGGGGSFSYERSTNAPSTASATWTGAVSSDWSNTGNWNGGFTPLNNTTVTVPSGTPNNPIITSAVGEIFNLTINSGATLQISGSGSLTVDTSITQNGTFIINSDATGSGSLILEGSFSGSGNITYNRYIPSGDWHLISSPVTGQDIDDFATASGLEMGSGSNQGLGTYNTTSDTWSYYQGTLSSDVFSSVFGYALNLASSMGGTVQFNGDLKLDNASTGVVNVASGNGYILYGNPYACYVDSSQFLTYNVGLESETLWLWDPSGNGGFGEYITKVTDDNFEIAPGQGFFVQYPNSLGTFSSTSFNYILMRKHSTNNTFLKPGNTRPEIHLELTNGVNIKKTKLYYINETTTGFDNGYDGPLFGGVANDFAVYTHTVNNESERNLAIQSIPEDYENLVVPVGVNALSGSTITFTVQKMNLPSELDIYLEDKVTNTFTRLDEVNAKYRITLNSNLNGIGRFYIHTTSQALSTEDVPLTDISIYNYGDHNLRVTGVHTEQADLIIYNILGAQVFNSSFEGNGVNDVVIPNLKSGLYIVEVKTSKGNFNKKVIID